MRIMQAKQPALDEHSSDVAELCRRGSAPARACPPRSSTRSMRAAELHDVGKVGIPDAILDKRGRLDESEWEFMRQHTILGERILNAAPALRPVARLVRATHERWDGGGYPDGLAGEQIPLGARIIAVCDAYEAMIADRAYRARSRARRRLRGAAPRGRPPVRPGGRGGLPRRARRRPPSEDAEALRRGRPRAGRSTRSPRTCAS